MSIEKFAEKSLEVVIDRENKRLYVSVDGDYRQERMAVDLAQIYKVEKNIRGSGTQEKYLIAVYTYRLNRSIDFQVKTKHLADRLFDTLSLVAQLAHTYPSV